MLLSLHIRNYILIDSLDISFPEGLVIITGQTGAGKSILLGALSLLSGAKADASLIFPGADSCVLEAEFASDDTKVREVLESEDIEYDPEGLIVRRVVAASGRSRCFVNDCPVSVDVLKRLSELLIDIHSQHAALALSKRDFQLSALDFFAGNAERLSQCRELWREMNSVASQAKALRENLARIEADRDYNTAQFQQLDAAKLVDGELEDLEIEHKALANAEAIMEALGGAIEALSPSGDELGVCAGLKDAARRLSGIAAYIGSALELSERLDSLRIEANDVLSELEQLRSRVDCSPSRLEAVEERLSALYSLMKKHACGSVAELIEKRDSLASCLLDSSELEEKIASLEASWASLKLRWEAVCAQLSDARKKAAPEFAAQITSSLHFLELERSEFKVGIEPCTGGPDGADRVSFLFAADGRSPQDLSKVASGGEMSRIMLCLKALMARFTGMPTMIFDEIDTGVSGSVADKMGQMVCLMGRDMQVFAITHLPQVAAKGDAHYLVSKSTDAASSQTTSHIARIQGEEREREIARLLSGTQITSAALANARELLGA